MNLSLAGLSLICEFLLKHTKYKLFTGGSLNGSLKIFKLIKFFDTMTNDTRFMICGEKMQWMTLN